MNSPLDQSLALLRAEPAPAIGSDFAGGVWREIARRRPAADLPWLNVWQNPRLLLAATAAAVAVGLAMTALWPAPRLDDRLAARGLDDRAALGLDAFAANAPHLPSTLIAQR